MSRGPSRARQLGYILPASSSCRVVWPRRDPSSRARLINWTMDAALQRRSESDSKVVEMRNTGNYSAMIYGVSVKSPDPDAYAFYFGADSTYWAKGVGYDTRRVE